MTTRAHIGRCMPAILGVVVMCLASLAATATGANTATSDVSVTILSYTALDPSGCASSVPDVTSFGSITAGLPVRTGSDCTVEFGSPNNSAMLRLYQRDGGGDAMRPAPASGTGVLGMWTFDEGIGALTDQSSTANSGTTPAAAEQPTQVAGPAGSGSAFRFDGSNDRISIPFHASYDITSLTVDAWVKIPVGESDGYVATRGNTSCSNAGLCSWAIWVDHTGALEIDVENGNTEYYVATGTALNDDAWHHVAMTVDAANVLRAYVDGIERGTALTLPGPIDTGTAPIAVGANSPNSGARLNGSVDELRITAGAANAATIRRWALGRIPDWAVGTNDFGTSGARFFGACLHAVTDGATAGAGAWDDEAGCPAGDSSWWNAIPATATPASTVALAPHGDDDARAHLRFGIRTRSDQPPGAYEAPVRFEVVAPAA